METLILSCGTGGGHHTAARAIAEELKRRGHAVTAMDPYDLVGDTAANAVGNLYIRLVQRSPKLFGCLYAMGNAYRKLPLHSPVYWANGKLSDSMARHLQQHRYDCIIMTHMFPAHTLANLKGKMPLPKTVLVATDYTCIPLMEESDCDYYVIPASDLTEEFCRQGIPQQRILPYGIPVGRDFSANGRKEAARRQLGLDMDRAYILLSGGSIGAGQIEQSVAVLNRFLQENEKCTLLVLCGSHQRLYEKLKEKYGGREQFQIMQSTSRMADYMAACDLFITKPGGLSSTEAAVSGVPLIHISPIPGCERCNARYFADHGMSLYVKNPQKELLPVLQALAESCAADDMATAQRDTVNPFAADDLCDFVEQICQGAGAASDKSIPRQFDGRETNGEERPWQTTHPAF